MTVLRILALYALCGAAAFAADDKKDRHCDLADDAESGLIFVSAMLPDSDAMGAPISFSYNYSRVGDKLDALIDPVFVVTRKRLLIPLQSDFDGVFGKLIVLKLKAGDYLLNDWKYVDSLNEKWSRAGVVKKIPFRVTAGRATYLGSLEPKLIPYGQILGRATARAWPTGSDQSKRDVSLFLRRCPQVDIMDVDVSPLDLSPWLP